MMIENTFCIVLLNACMLHMQQAVYTVYTTVVGWCVYAKQKCCWLLQLQLPATSWICKFGDGIVYSQNVLGRYIWHMISTVDIDMTVVNYNLRLVAELSWAAVIESRSSLHKFVKDPRVFSFWFEWRVHLQLA